MNIDEAKKLSAFEKECLDYLRKILLRLYSIDEGDQ